MAPHYRICWLTHGNFCRHRLAPSVLHTATKDVCAGANRTPAGLSLSLSVTAATIPRGRDIGRSCPPRRCWMRCCTTANRRASRFPLSSCTDERECSQDHESPDRRLACICAACPHARPCACFCTAHTGSARSQIVFKSVVGSPDCSSIGRASVPVR